MEPGHHYKYGCGKYICPSYDPNTNPNCESQQATFSRDDCLPANCSSSKLPKYHNDPDECCPTVTCECPPPITPSPDCTDPYQILTNTTGECPTETCTCQCPPVGVNCSSSPGCRVVPTNNVTSTICGCIESWECVPDPDLCPPVTHCSTCENRTKVETVPGSGECEADCDLYRCDPKPCPSYSQPELPCPKYHRNVPTYDASDTDKCCPIDKCECKTNEDLKDECEQWYDYECEVDYLRNRTNDETECCPEYECICNQANCPPPVNCSWLTLETHWPPPFATGDHDDVCCASYNCTCVDVPCPPYNETCPQYQKVGSRDNTTNPCCPIHSCVCDPDQYPAYYKSPENKPDENGVCSHPGQKPDPVYDDPTGCLARCVCYPSDEVLGYCAEYQTVLGVCHKPRVVTTLTPAADNPDYYCCPKPDCQCPNCADVPNAKNCSLCEKRVLNHTDSCCGDIYRCGKHSLCLEPCNCLITL